MELLLKCSIVNIAYVENGENMLLIAKSCKETFVVNKNKSFRTTLIRKARYP